MVESNVEELGALLADTLMFTTFLGESITKKQDLQAHESGAFAIHDIRLSEQRIQFVGGVAIVTCLARIDSSFDDDRTDKAFRFTRVWAGVGGALQVVAGQATLVFDETSFA